MTETPDPTPESTPEPTDESSDTPEQTNDSTQTSKPTETTKRTDESTETPEPTDESTETPESTETETPEPTDESTDTSGAAETETPEPTETEAETDQGDEPGAVSSHEASGNRSKEYVADWEISNEGTVDADRLLLTRLSVDVRGLNGSTREEALKSTRITLARYEGDDVPEFPGTLWALARRLNESDIELDSGDVGPELPARESKVRTFELGVRFDYSGLSGAGGYSVAASPEFTIEQS
jgi:hypothetical protein